MKKADIEQLWSRLMENLRLWGHPYQPVKANRRNWYFDAPWNVGFCGGAQECARRARQMAAGQLTFKSTP